MAMSQETYNAIIEVQHWIHTKGRDCMDMRCMIEQLAPLFCQYGVPIDRFFIGTTIIHPQAAAWVWKWESPGVVTEGSRGKEFYARRYDIVGRDAPIVQLEFNKSFRIRVTDDHIPRDCRSMFEDMGYMDMFGLRFEVNREFGGGVTWATKKAGGFSEDNIAIFNAVMPALSTLIQLLLNDLRMKSLLRAYLGDDPGTRVHRGSINRGDGTTIRSVVWFSDIRGFTRLSGIHSRDVVIDLINDIFETTDNVLSSKGGEVLKFMGDGLMGVFTDERKNGERISGPCERAREAAEELQIRLRELQQTRTKKGLPFSDVGIGLHYGDVSYGNIGAPSRLDFTVIGPSVNLASRVEGLCSKLEVSVLASEDFVNRDSRLDLWHSRGKHLLKGVPEPVQVFELVESSNAKTP